MSVNRRDGLRAGCAPLAAIAKSQLWVEELLAGGSFAEIAKRESKGERQIRLLFPLAFMLPATVRGLIDGVPVATTITELANSRGVAFGRLSADSYRLSDIAPVRGQRDNDS
jgi:hypothetical protein